MKNECWSTWPSLRLVCGRRYKNINNKIKRPMARNKLTLNYQITKRMLINKSNSRLDINIYIYIYIYINKHEQRTSVSNQVPWYNNLL